MKKIFEVIKSSILNSFKVGLPDTSINKYQVDSATKNYVSSCFKTLILITLLFILAQVYFLIDDIVAGNFGSYYIWNQYYGIGLIAEVLTITSSIIVLLYVSLSIVKEKDNYHAQKVTITTYYFIVTICCSLFVIAKTLRNGGLMNVHSSIIYIILLLSVSPSYTRAQNYIFPGILLLSIVIPAIMVAANPDLVTEEVVAKELDGIGWILNNMIFVIFGALVAQFSYAKSISSKLKSVVLIEANELLKQKTETDELTQVANRRAMKMYIDMKEAEWKDRKEGVAFLMLDIDFFKKYNDFYGHLRGDECLKRVAQAACIAAQNYNGSVFRYGGEEFVVIAENVEEAQALNLCKEIHKEIGKLKISHEGINGDKETMLTVSIGLNYETTFKRVSNQWILDADQQLYYAKHEGRNCTAYRNALYNTYHKVLPGEEAKRTD